MQQNLLLACGLVTGATLLDVVLAIPMGITGDPDVFNILPVGYAGLANILGILTVLLLGYGFYRIAVSKK